MILLVEFTLVYVDMLHDTIQVVFLGRYLVCVLEVIDLRLHLLEL